MLLNFIFQICVLIFGCSSIFGSDQVGFEPAGLDLAELQCGDDIVSRCLNGEDMHELNASRPLSPIRLSPSPVGRPKRVAAVNASEKIAKMLKLGLLERDVSPEFKCPESGTICSGSVDLAHHRESVYTGPQFECPICGIFKSGIGILRNHLSSHRDLGRKQISFQCEQCGKVCANTRNLVDHRSAVHAGERRHECKDCGIRYGYRTCLWRHRRKFCKGVAPSEVAQSGVQGWYLSPGLDSSLGRESVESGQSEELIDQIRKDVELEESESHSEVI